MIDQLGLIGAVACVTYLTRIAGLGLGQRTVPSALHRFLAYVPIAAFAALAMPDLGEGTTDLLPRLAGAVAAAIVVWRSNRLAVGLVIGMTTFWFARILIDNTVG
jgi:branched-subunit amino acid transport protein